MKMELCILLFIVVNCVVGIPFETKDTENTLPLERQKSSDLETLTKEIALGYINKYNVHPVYVTGFDLQIKSVYRSRLANEIKHLDQKLEHISQYCIINRSNHKQQSQTSEYNQTITESKVVTITDTREISGTVEIPQLPLLDSFSMKFTRSNATVESHTTAIEKSTPPQKVDIEPQSKTSISYQLYAFKDVYNYLLDFEIDESSVVQLKDREKYDLIPPTNIIFLVINEIAPDKYAINLLDVLRNYPEVNIRPSSGTSLESINGKYVLKNFPMKYEISTNSRALL